MAVVTIYNQGNLQYVVLPTREVLSKYPDDIALSIHKAEQSPFWRDKKRKQFLQVEGTQFFKRNADKLDTSFSMEDSNGKMSAGFFLYLAFRRFQNQQVQAHFINDDEVDNLLKPDDTAKKGDDLSKLLILEKAIEYLVKAREYVEDKGDAPEGVEVQTGARGGLFYDPDQVKDKKHQEEMPSGIREVEVVQAEPLEVDDEEDDDAEHQGPETNERFIERMKENGFIPVGEAAKNYPTITKDEKDKLVADASRAGNGDFTDSKTIITPNIAVVNDDGVIVQVTTSDGQIMPVSEEAGKLLIYINPRGDDLTGTNKVQQEWRTPPNVKNPLGATSKQYSVAYNKSQTAKKHIRATALGSKIDGIEKRIAIDIQSKDRRTKDAALAIAIIHDTFRRIGKGSSSVTWDGKNGHPGPKKDKNTKSGFVEDYTPTFGVTSMQAQHIIVRGDKVKLRFLGKRGQLNEVDVTNPQVIEELKRRKNAAKKPTDGIIDVNEPVVNAYLKNITGGDFTAKDFRTYHGTKIAYDVIGKRAIPKIDRVKLMKSVQNAISKGGIANEQAFGEFLFTNVFRQHHTFKRNIVGEPVSKRLGNKPKVSIDNYINPLVFSDNPFNKNWDGAFEKELTSILKTKYPEAEVKAAQDWLSAVNKKNYGRKGLDNPRKPKNWKKGDAVPPGTVPKKKGKNK